MTRVLVVDNDSLEQQKIARYLQGRGATYDVAADPMAAIAKLATEAYDYVFLDLDLGAGMSDGEGVLAWMEQHGKLIPTLVISELANRPSVIRLAQAYAGIVRERITHSDLNHLSDLVDKLMLAKAAQAARPTKAGTDTAVTDAIRVIGGLIIAIVVLLGTLTVVAMRAPTGSFLQIVAAAMLVLIFVGVVALVSIGRVSERGLLRVVSDLLKKIPALGGKR